MRLKDDFLKLDELDTEWLKLQLKLARIERKRCYDCNKILIGVVRIERNQNKIGQNLNNF